DRTNEQMIQICGPDPRSPTRPDPNCGSTTGDLAVANSHVQEERQNIQIAAQRIEDLHSRIAIQYNRLQTVYNIRADTIKFVDDANQQIDAMTEEQNEYAHYEDLLKAAGSFLGGLISENPGEVIGGITGAEASAFADMQRQLELQKQQLQHA